LFSGAAGYTNNESHKVTSLTLGGFCIKALPSTAKQTAIFPVGQFKAWYITDLNGWSTLYGLNLKAYANYMDLG
jgi:hypothetical protein